MRFLPGYPTRAEIRYVISFVDERPTDAGLVASAVGRVSTATGGLKIVYEDPPDGTAGDPVPFPADTSGGACEEDYSGHISAEGQARRDARR